MHVTHRLSDQAERGRGPDFVLEVWQRRKWVALLVFTAAFTGAVGLTLWLPDLYRATATALVERPQVSEAFVRPSVTAELETRIQMIHQRAMSRSRLMDVITSLGLYPDLRDKLPVDALVGRMRRDIVLDLKGVEETYGRRATIAFTLSYIAPDPETAARVANTMVALYVEENTKSRTQQAARTAEFLKERLGEVKRELTAQEQRADEFKSRHSGQLPQHVEANLAALGRLNTELRLNGEYQIRAMQRREQLERELADADSGEAPAPPAGTPAAQLVKLRQELADLRRRFSDQYPDVIRVQAEIAALERERGQAGADGPALSAANAAVHLRQSLAELNSEFKSLQDHEKFLRQVIAGYETRIENAPERHEQLAQLTRDYDITKERYETLLKRYEEAQLADSLEQGQNVEQFRVLDPAMPPTGPAAPNRQWLLMMGFFVSVALAFGAVVAAERLDTSFHTVDDLRAFVNGPTLASIRVIQTDADGRRQRLRVALIAVLFIVGVALIVAGSHYVASGNETIVRRLA